jgi:vacuolar-type H+-ATPase subunit E/Vma4
MGVEKLTTSLVGEASKEAEEIVKTAQWHVDKMLSDEQSKESSFKEEAKTEVKSRLDEQKNERLAWARLEAKRIIAESKEDAISNSLEDFFSQLKGICKEKSYKTFLKKSVQDAVKELGGKPVVHITKADATALGKVNGCKVISDLDALGGAIVEAEDKSVRIDLRLETLFELQRDNLRKEVYERLFGRG